MRHALLLATVVAVASGQITAASATVITYEHVYSIPWDSTTIPVSIQLFDPSLGTLHSGTLTVSQHSSLTFALDNDNPYGTATPVVLAQYLVTGFSPIQTFSSAISADDGDGAGVQAGGPDYVTGAFSYDWQDLYQQSWTDPGALAGMLGTGTVPLNSLPSSESFVPVSGVEWQALDRVYEQRWAMTYDYTPTGATTPEPGTLALMACGLGVGWLRRRRRR